MTAYRFIETTSSLLGSALWFSAGPVVFRLARGQTLGTNQVSKQEATFSGTLLKMIYSTLYEIVKIKQKMLLKSMKLFVFSCVVNAIKLDTKSN